MQGKRVRVFGVVGIVLLAVLAGAALLPTRASSGTSDAPREVRLVARDMTFYLDGKDTPNPTLEFKAGERIRLVLRNEDPGMDHDFVVSSWKVSTRLLEGKGEAAVVFRVPGTRGTQSYSCTPHAQMMRGTIEIR